MLEGRKGLLILAVVPPRSAPPQNPTGLDLLPFHHHRHFVRFNNCTRHCDIRNAIPPLEAAQLPDLRAEAAEDGVGESCSSPDLASGHRLAILGV